MLTNLIFFIISALGLVVSAAFLLKSLYKIAKFLRISEFTAAFIIMAIATAAPELFVGILSAVSKVPALSLGNLIGASIIDLTLITGIFVLISREIKTKIGEEKDIHYVIFSIILVIILFLIGNSLSRIDGILLLALFVFNTCRMFKRKKQTRKLKKGGIRRIEIAFLIFLLALIILFISANYAVKYVSLLAIDLKLPQIIVGLFLLSIATTSPELIFGIEACIMKHKDMAMGDIIGGVFTYMTLVLGLVSLISPIKAALSPFIISSLFLILSAVIFLRFLKTERELKPIEGIALIILYALFVIIEFFLTS